jgi:hypothetical protein
MLWGNISHPSEGVAPSMIAAVEATEEYAIANDMEIGRASIWTYLRQMQPALHLWGAWVMRGGRFITDSDSGYDYYTDCGALMTEAMALLRELRLWRESTNDQDKLLTGEMIEPWSDWQPHQWRNGWPVTGVLADGAPFDEFRPVRRKRGS